MDDYTAEIQAFYDWLETNELSTASISLFHALLSIKYKAGWIESFTVAMPVLELRTGARRRTVERARLDLEEKGLITWSPRGGGKSAEYTLISLIRQDERHIVRQNSNKNDATNDAQQDERQSVRQKCNEIDATDDACDSSSDKNDAKMTALLKKEKEKIYAHARVDFSTIMETWKEVFGAEMKPSHIERVVDHLENDGMEEVLIVEALERTRDADEATMKYTWATLRDWMKNGLKTMRDLIEYERQHDEKRSQFQQQKPKLHVVRNEEPKERPVVDREPIDLLGMEG
ncbi:Replication initiation and membrane attachment [compost metagenome]